MRDNRSPIWGGATLGLVVGLILGLFVGTYWMTALYAVLIGAASGIVANVLAWPGDIVRRRDVERREREYHAVSRAMLNKSAEDVLRETSAADFKTTPTAEEASIEVVWMVEDGESWRAGYDSLEAFYAAHEGRHPDIRTYAARAPRR